MGTGSKTLAGAPKRSRSPCFSSDYESESIRRKDELETWPDGEKPTTVNVSMETCDGGTSSFLKQKVTGNASLKAVPIVHYPSSFPFPIKLQENFPEEPYASRHDEIKSAVHWGQRKLILSEIQFFSLCAASDVPYHVVYVGAAPGTHISFLAMLLDYKHSWELIDPGKFDREALEKKVGTKQSQITIRNEFFSNAMAYNINTRRLREVFPGLSVLYQYETTSRGVYKKKPVIHDELEVQVGSELVARSTEAIPSMYEPLLEMPRGLELLCLAGMKSAKPLLFISDIRTGNVKLPNYEDHVAENMRAQESWTRILQADFSLLKFRLPYTRISRKFGGRDSIPQQRLIQPDGTVQYVRGDILLPIWTRPTSTEGRLIVPQGAFQVPYKVRKIEDQFFFFNSRVREQMHFNHVFASDSVFNHHFDPSAEINCLSMFLHWLYSDSYPQWPQEERKEKILLISESLSKHLGMGFDDAIHRRDALLLQVARGGRCVKDEGRKASFLARELDAGGSLPTEVRRDDFNVDNKVAKNEGKSIGTEEEEKDSSPLKARKEKLPQSYFQAKKMIELAARERERPMWYVNIDETKYAEPSGLWITTKIPQ